MKRWLIRREQMHALGEALRADFEERMLAHARRFFAARCAELGEPGARAQIRHAIARAAQHQLTAERDVARFLNLVFVLGPAFDERLPWAAAILDDDTTSGARENLDRLYREAMARLAS